MTDTTAAGGRQRAGRRTGAARSCAQDDGFALVEVVAAMTILVIVLVSFSTLLVDSLSAALRTKQSEVAASIASDMVENAKALGLSVLLLDLGAVSATCPSYGALPVPVRTSLATATTSTVASTDLRQCFTILADSYTYTVTPSVAIGTPDTVTVRVTWTSGSYSTTGLIGQ